MHKTMPFHLISDAFFLFAISAMPSDCLTFSVCAVNRRELIGPTVLDTEALSHITIRPNQHGKTHTYRCTYYTFCQFVSPICFASSFRQFVSPSSFCQFVSPVRFASSFHFAEYTKPHLISRVANRVSGMGPICFC